MDSRYKDKRIYQAREWDQIKDESLSFLKWSWQNWERTGVWFQPVFKTKNLCYNLILLFPRNVFLQVF